MTEATSKASSETFAELFESTSTALKEGEVVSGTVLSIDDDHVQIDIGFKSEGFVPTWEFMEDDGTIRINAGDTVDVLLEEAEDGVHAAVDSGKRTLLSRRAMWRRTL